MAMDVIFTCHLCLIKSDNVLEIFGNEGIARSIADVLRQHFWFDITENSNLQQNRICHECWEKVESFHDFYKLVQQKHQTLSTLLPKCDLNDATDKEDEPKRSDHQTVEHIKLEPEQADDDDRSGDYDCMDYEEADRVMGDSVDTDEPSNESEDYSTNRKIKRNKTTIKATKHKRVATQRVTKTLRKNIKDIADSNESLTELIAKYITPKCDKCPGAENPQVFMSLEDANKHYLTIHDQPGYLMCCDKRLYTKQQLKQHLTWHEDQNKFKCSECSEGFKSNPKLKKHKQTVHPIMTFSCKQCDRSFKKEYLLNKHKRTHDVDLDRKAKKFGAEQTQTHDAGTIGRFFVMDCDICGVRLTSYSDARAHHRTEHKQNGYLICCNKKFYKLYRIMQHCTWHIDPDAFNCKLCHKTYSDGVSLRDHMVNLHSRDEDKVYKCETCDKRFSKKHMLTSHHRLYHIRDEDKKFECHVCGQRFVILPFLRHHIKRVHDHAFGHICDICAKYFKCAQSYDLHYSIEHTHTAQKVQCERCGKWLKHQKTLEKHMMWHNDGTETCKICGRVSANKRALRAHTKLAHTPAAYTCTVCEKKFKKKQTLKEHMAMHAGISHLYTCTYCSKPFRSSANMYAHRKRAHPKEYADSKAAASSGL